jgi:hypothetical protein
VFDYICDFCAYTEDRMVEREKMNDQHCQRQSSIWGTKCGHKLRRLMPGPQTTFKDSDTSPFKS